MERDVETLVLTFNTTGPVHLAAQLHAPECAALSRAGNGRGKVKMLARAGVHAKAMVSECLAEDVADLNEREYPVRRCKCCDK